ncbi:MAG: protein kinase domain-containing protein [Planctomycetota bacterium]|jgi:TolB-like protein/Tfp pilus assembly protein PilF
MRRIGRYAIMETLGEGGMGVVYVAEDLRLERRVALKTIHSHLANDITRQRMWREARSASAVSHPNICQIFEFGEHEGELFLAMELLKGESLAERLERGPLPLADALEVGIAIALALEAVHGRGVVHRDLKPSNIFLTPHGAKLLDFGLALPLGTIDSAERITRTGVFVGTPGFMAPELWSGGEPSSASDLFALGAMLIEMIAGVPAFRGDNPAALLHSILHDPAPTLTGGAAIDAVDRIVQGALAKDPADRPSSAGEFARALRMAQALIDGTELPSALVLHRVLVVPFRLLGARDELDFLPMGLADALISSLGRVDGMVLKSSQVGAKYAGDEFDPGRIARETEVQHVLTGTVQEAGDRLRVSAQLMAVPDGSLVWSETLESTIGDLFELQDDLARRIAESFTSEVVGRRKTSVQRDRPATARAYEYFLRGKQMGHNFGMLASARGHYRECLREDPQFAPGWAELARVCRVMAKYSHGNPEADLEEAKDAFRRALEINPQLARTHNLYAYHEIEELGRSKDAMVRLLDHTRRSPTDPDLFAGLVVACRFCGLLEASVEADRRARRLDPGIRTSVAYTHFVRGDYEAAMRSDDEDYSWNRFFALPMLGRGDEAVELVREREQRTQHTTERNMLAVTRAAIEGDRDWCVAAARAVFESSFQDPEGLFFDLRSLVHVGEHGMALKKLGEIVDRGFWCVGGLENDPWLDPVRGTPEFQSALERARAGRGEAIDAYEAAGGVELLGDPRP